MIDAGVVTIGRGTYGALNVKVYGTATSSEPVIRVGNYCSIGPESLAIINGDHRLDWVTTFPIRSVYGLDGAGEDGHPVRSGPLVIGHDVWIGARALLFGGTTIGHGAAIASGSVVTKDVPPYAIVAGNPARIVRSRFTEAEVTQLLDLRWWELPEAAVIELVDILSAPLDVELLASTIEAKRE
jgi:acetyltransferase-like isoleucine patch superfamily enzyme